LCDIVIPATNDSKKAEFGIVIQEGKRFLSIDRPMMHVSQRLLLRD
jgi:hypothetical protein